MEIPANLQRSPEYPAISQRCEGHTKSKKVCSLKAEGQSFFCLLHDPNRAEERAQKQSERGKAGNQKKAENKAARFKEIRLSTTKQIQEALTESLNAVRSSSADVIAKANAVARLSSVALSIISTRDIEDQVDELRETIASITGKRTLQ